MDGEHGMLKYVLVALVFQVIGFSKKVLLQS